MSNVIKFEDWKAKKNSGLSVNDTRLNGSERKSKQRANNACTVLGALLAFPKNKRHERFCFKVMAEFMLSGGARDKMTERIVDYIEKNKNLMEQKLGRRITINVDDKRACKKLRREIDSLCGRKYPKY